LYAKHIILALVFVSSVSISYARIHRHDIVTAITASSLVKNSYKPASVSLSKSKADRPSEKITDPACLMVYCLDGYVNQFFLVRCAAQVPYTYPGSALISESFKHSTANISSVKRPPYHYQLIFPHHHFW